MTPAAQRSLVVQAQPPLLERLLDTPQLARVIPRLPAETLHRVIERCGLEDCAPLVALATPAQLTRIFDLDLWRSPRAGDDERFEADRFGVWLEVLLDGGHDAAARTIAELDDRLIATALAQHVRVFDTAAISLPGALDGGGASEFPGRDHDLSCEVGGYLVAARQTDAWDSIVAVLVALDAGHADAFHRIMRGCRQLSNSRPEEDGFHALLDDREQALFDLASDRDLRREDSGYLQPAQARAFLQASRIARFDEGPPPPDPIARAYGRTAGAAAEPDAAAGPAAPSPAGADDAVAAVITMLADAGIGPQLPRGLLGAAAATRPRLVTALENVRDTSPAVFAARSGELAFLANALAAGCSIQARPFTLQEASDAVAAACNLGLENWPHPAAAHPGSMTPDDILLTHHDLIAVFQVGWTTLHEQVCMSAARQLAATLGRVRCPDRATQAALNNLRTSLIQHWEAGAPWRARDDLDVLAMLDLPAWAALLCLIDECPTVHAVIGAMNQPGTRSVDGQSFTFIATNRDIDGIRLFLRQLPRTLNP